ncbi:inositol monophosphatase family protein [Amedibacillus sp. YH-ame10]
MYQELYERLFLVSKQAGVVAKIMQQGILNEGKKVDLLEGEDAHHKAMREAKTKADEIVQEMILTSLLPKYKDILTLDVEEDTESIQLFTKQDYAMTLVLDPIDGTLDYLQQRDTYSICSAILQDQDMKVALVYFPARDEMYSYCDGVGTLFYKKVSCMDINDGEELNYIPNEHTPSIIYKNSRLSQDIVQHLIEQGYTVVDDQEHRLGCPDAIYKCMRGEALAYFSDTRNIRDILMGAILGKMKYGHYYTYLGEDAVWESHGRQKEIVFSIYEKEKIFK